MAYILKDFGSYTVGGRLHHVAEGTPETVQFTRDAAYAYDPRGHFAVEHTYVQYFVPEGVGDDPPVVLVHGGGLHGSTWETTPDGRPGWLHLLLARGHSVHVVDAVERGRAGFAPGLWPGKPILRSLEEAWALFRFGPPEGFAQRAAFPGQQFPVEALETFAQRFVPRWLTTAPLHSAGLVAVLERTGPAIIICHSQGGETTFSALERRPDLVVAVLAVEPSAFPSDADPFRACPLVIAMGDHLDVAHHWRERARRWAELVDTARTSGAKAWLLDTAKEVAPGGSHMLMMDRHMAPCLEAMLAHSRRLTGT